MEELARDLLDAMKRVVDGPGHWVEKREVVRSAANERDDGTLAEFIQWFDDVDADEL